MPCYARHVPYGHAKPYSRRALIGLTTYSVGTPRFSQPSCLTTESMRLCPSSGFPKPVGSGNSRVYHHAIGNPYTHKPMKEMISLLHRSMHRHMAFATSTYLVFCDCSLSPHLKRWASCRKRRRVSRETHHRKRLWWYLNWIRSFSSHNAPACAFCIELCLFAE